MSAITTRHPRRAHLLTEDCRTLWGFCRGCHTWDAIDVTIGYCSECAWMGVRRSRPEPWGRVITHGAAFLGGALVFGAAAFAFVPNVRF